LKSPLLDAHALVVYYNTIYVHKLNLYKTIQYNTINNNVPAHILLTYTPLRINVRCVAVMMTQIMMPVLKA